MPSPGSALLRERQWFRLPRASCPALNLRGKDARFFLVAWVKRGTKSSRECEAVAGMWNETVETRQYRLFLNLGIWESADQACGHLSSTGAPSPGYIYCTEAAIGNSPVSLDTRPQAAFTFDGNWGRVCLDGKFDGRPGLNPYFWPCAVNDGGKDGSDFTAGAVFRNGEMGNGFAGQLGGLAVYGQALLPEQIARLYASRQV